MSRPARLVAPAGLLVALIVAAGLLQWAGRGSLGSPPLTEPGRWIGWLEGREPVVAAFGLLRLLALASLWYLALVSVVGASLRLVGAASLVRLADRLTIGPVRRILAGTMSLGLAASGVVSVAAPALRAPVAAATQSAYPTTTTPTTTTATSTSTTTTATTTTAVTGTTSAMPPATVTMHRLGPVDTTPSPAMAPVPEIGGADGAGRWTVKPGECFWSIADRVLTERWGRAPSDAEIVPYWTRLIEANRHELVQRDNPDLIFPGQTFAVPNP